MMVANIGKPKCPCNADIVSMGGCSCRNIEEEKWRGGRDAHIYSIDYLRRPQNFKDIKNRMKEAEDELFSPDPKILYSGVILKDLRMDKGMSVRDAANCCGVLYDAYSKIERGIRMIPREKLFEMVKLIQGYGI